MAIVGAGFVFMWLWCMPPMLIASIVPIPAGLGTLPYALVLGVATFFIAVLVLTPLRRWIDEPERRPHHARVGAAVGAAYVVTSLVVGYVWIAFSGR